MVFDASANIVCYAVAEIDTQTTGQLMVEHDAEQLIDSVYRVIDQVHKSLGKGYKNIAQAGMATQRSSIVCWDKLNGEALSPVISWQDRRTAGRLDYAASQDDLIHQLTGLYLNPHYGASKIKWCLENNAAVQKSLNTNSLCIAPMASFILFKLLDERPFVTDPANASRTLLMNYKTLKWEKTLLDLFSVPDTILPKITYTQSAFGNIVRHSHSIPLVLCTGDQSAVIYSQGELADSEVFINAGTGAFIQKPDQNIPELKQEKLLASVVYADRKKTKYVIEGTVNGAGRALQWFAQQSKTSDYEKSLNQWCKAYANPPIFFNAISGIGSPYWIADHESYFLSEASNEEKFVAIVESIIFLIVDNIRCMQIISSDIRQIKLAGGLANIPAFCQKLSNLSNCQVLPAKETEATAKGVFFLLSRSPVLNLEEAYSATFHPQNDEMLFNRYHIWRKLMLDSFQGQRI